MKAVFADSFYYLALMNRNDADHTQAVEIAGRIRFRMVTAAWVVTELADAMAQSSQRSGFLALLASLEADPGVTIVTPSRNLYDAGLILYARRPDKDWSLTDCISFVVMERFGLTEALTGDIHFGQAGYQALMS